MEDHDVSAFKSRQNVQRGYTKLTMPPKFRYSEILDYHNVDAGGAPTMEGFAAEP